MQVMTYFAFAALIAAIFIFLYTRCLRSTVMLVGCSLVAMVWLLGLISTFGFELDPYSILVPFLVFAIGVSHGAQKMNGIMQDVGRGTHRLVAARYTFRRLFLPGVTALSADAVGFAVLMLIDIPVIKDLALTASIGVAILIFTNLLLLPVLLSFVGVSLNAARRSLKEEKEESTGAGAGRIWGFLERFTERRWAIGAVATAFILAAGGWIVGLNLKIGDLDPGAPELRAHSRYNQDNAYVTANYALSTDQFAVIVKTPPDGVQKYETLIEADRLAWGLQQVPGVQTTVSLVDGVRQITAGTYEGSPKWYTLSRNQQVLNYGAHQSIVDNPNLFNNDGTIMPVIAYLSDHKAETLDRVVKAADEFSQQHSTGDRQFLLAAGTAGIEAATNIVVKKAQRNMLLYVYSAVILLCFITFRNWRAVVVAVLPLYADLHPLRGAHGPAEHRGEGRHPAGHCAGGGNRGGLCPVSAQRSAQLDAGRTVFGRVVQTRRPVHRQGGRTGRHHAGRRCRHLGVFTDQISGRYGHSPYFHVYLEHDWRAGVDPGPVALSAPEG